MVSQGGIDLGIEGITDAVRVGQGSFGTVYRATQEAYGRTVAVKVLSAPLVDEPSRKAFDRECRALGTISDHPGIVTLYAAGIAAGDRPYLIMEFLSGGSLADVLAGGRMPWEQAVAIGIKIAGALATAHAAGVLHRDIKPENVLLSAYNEPELADFGVAKVQGGTNTSMGTITGSIAYAAPEVLSGLAATETSDVWALSCTVATLLAGVSPFHRDGEQSLHPLLMRIITAEPNDLRPFGVPDDVCGVIVAALAKDTWERTPSAVAFGESLQQVQQRRGVPVTPMTVRGSSDPAVTAGPGPTAAGPAPPVATDHVTPAKPDPQPATLVGEESATVRRPAPLGAATPPTPIAAAPVPTGRRWGRKPKDEDPPAPVGLEPPPPPPPPPTVQPAPVAPPPVAAPPARPAPTPTPGPGDATEGPNHRGRWWIAGIAAAAAVVLLLALLVGRGSSGRGHTASATTTVTAGRGPTPTSTATTATTATTAPPVRPVFADDFTNPASGWAPDLGQDGSGTATYKPDGYHITALKPMPALNTYSAASPFKTKLLSLSVTVTALLTGAPGDGVGVRCDQGVRAHLRYTFEIHGDGSWVVFKIDDTGNAALLQGQSPNVINVGARPNLITGTCREVGTGATGATKLTMLVNGVTLGTVTDPHPGQVAWHAGLIIYRATANVVTEARFNAFQTVDAGS